MRTAGLLSDFVKPDVALQSASQGGSSGVVGRYFDFGGGGRKIFLLEVGALTAAQTSTLQLVQAKDAGGTAAKNIDDASATINNSTATTALGAYKAKITFSTLLADSEITINGITFTASDGDTNAANREFGIYGLTDDQVAAELATLINDETYGVPGVKAAAVGSGGVLNLEAEEPGEASLDIEGVASTAVPAIVAAAAFVEVDASMLDSENGFTHVAAKVTNSANTQCSVAVIEQENFSPRHDGMGAKTTLF